MDAFALAIIAGGGPPALPHIPGSESDPMVARSNAGHINAAMEELSKVAMVSPGWRDVMISYMAEKNVNEVQKHA